MSGTVVPAYIPGGAYRVCDRCGEWKRPWQITKEWTNLMVCTATCRDPVPAQLSPPRVFPEGLPVPNARPEPPDIFVESYIIDPDSL